MILSLCLPLCEKYFDTYGLSIHELNPNTGSSSYTSQRYKSFKTYPIGCNHCYTMKILNHGSKIKIQHIGNYDDGNAHMSMQDGIRASDINRSIEDSESKFETNCNSIASGKSNYLSQVNISKNQSILNEAKYLYICSETIKGSLEQMNWIISQPINQKIIFNLRDIGYAWCNMHLFTSIIEKSKVIIGTEKAICDNFRYVLEPNHKEFSELLRILTKQGKIIISLHSNGSVNWGYDNENGSIKTSNNPECSFFKNQFVDWIAAGFMHSYHDGDLSVKTCVHTGIKWGEEEYALSGPEDLIALTCIIL